MKEQKSPKKPLLFYYAIVMLAVILFNSMVMPYFVRRQVTDVDYSTFLSQVEEGKVESVTIEDGEILFKGKDENGEARWYITGEMNDPNLVERLKDKVPSFNAPAPQKKLPHHHLTSLLPAAHPPIYGLGAAFDEEHGKADGRQCHDLRQKQRKNLRLRPDWQDLCRRGRPG